MKRNILLMSIMLSILTSCDNSKEKADLIIKAFDSEISTVGFNVDDNSFQHILDQYSNELENNKVESIVNEKISELFNAQLKKYVLRISIAEKTCKGNVGEYILMKSSSPLEIKADDGFLVIPFESKLIKPYKQLFEHDFSSVKGIVLKKQGDEFDKSCSFDLEWEKIINNESESEMGKLRYSIESVHHYGSTKDIVKSYIEVIDDLNKISDINIQIDRGKNSSASAPSNEAAADDNEQSNEPDKEVSKIDCDEFLNDYETFATSYVAFAKKYKKNQNDPSLLTDALKMNSEMAEWTKKSNEFDGCDDVETIKKLASIQAKIAEAALILSL